MLMLLLPAAAIHVDDAFSAIDVAAAMMPLLLAAAAAMHL